jgi:PAS domain S-box-containing protein
MLLVDDTPVNLVALRALLERPGYRLLTAQSGEQALTIALGEKVELILLDVAMPGMDGFEVARHLKSVERTRDVPILFLTAVATDLRYVYRAYHVGAVDYIVKPLDAEMVRKKVAVFAELVRHRALIEKGAQEEQATQRREYELRISELRLATDRRYRKLVEGIDNTIAWTTDEALGFTFVSRQATAMLGFPAEDLLRRNFWDRQLHAEDRERVLGLFRLALAQGVDFGFNHRLITADGRVLWVHTGISGVRGIGGAPPELHGFTTDVTEVKRAEEQALDAKRARDELLAVVSHDLRDPLSAIGMGAATIESFLTKVNDPGLLPPREAAGRIVHSVQRMERLIAQLLELTQVEAGGIAVERNPVAVAGLIDEALETFGVLAAQKGVLLKGHRPGTLVAWVDHDRVLQVISNLIGNAIKFTPQGGTVEIEAKQRESELLVSISDTGPGIAAEDLPQIWSRFWKSKREAGVGLGLAIAKALVEAHGGRIWAESRPGHGSTFRFTLPSVTAAEARPPSSA